MSLFPIEDKIFSLANRMDNYIHLNQKLYQSRLFGVVAKTGILIASPFYESILVVEHCALAIFNEIRDFNDFSSENYWKRGVHLRNVVKHFIGATVCPVIGLFSHVRSSLLLLHPYIYHWSQPNNNLFATELSGASELSRKLCFDSIPLLSKPKIASCDVNRITLLLNQAFEELNKNSIKQVISFKNGVIIEEGPKEPRQYLISDHQHERIWVLTKPENVWTLTEFVLSSHPFIAIEPANPPFSLAMTSFSPHESF